MRNKPGLIVLIITIIVVTYIAISTTLIDGKPYLKRAWDEVQHNKHIMNWQDGEVSVASLQEKRIKALFIPKPTTFAKINRSILLINGNRAVRVLFHTDNEGLQGPITVYFNPITKQVIGYDVNE